MALTCDSVSVRLLLPGLGAHPMGAVSVAGGLGGAVRRSRRTTRPPWALSCPAEGCEGTPSLSWGSQDRSGRLDGLASRFRLQFRRSLALVPAKARPPRSLPPDQATTVGLNGATVPFRVNVPARGRGVYGQVCADRRSAAG